MEQEKLEAGRALPNAHTISYLKGEITFQEYESLMENEEFEAELLLAEPGHTMGCSLVEVRESSPSRDKIDSNIDFFREGICRQRSSNSISSNASFSKKPTTTIGQQEQSEDDQVPLKFLLQT